MSNLRDQLAKHEGCSRWGLEDAAAIKNGPDEVTQLKSHIAQLREVGGQLFDQLKHVEDLHSFKHGRDASVLSEKILNKWRALK